MIVHHANGSSLYTLYPDDYGLSEESLDVVLRVLDYLKEKHFVLPIAGQPLLEGIHYIRKN